MHHSRTCPTGQKSEIGAACVVLSEHHVLYNDVRYAVMQCCHSMHLSFRAKSPKFGDVMICLDAFDEI